MTIKKTMLSLLSVVSVLLLVTQGYLFSQAYMHYTSSQRASVSNQIIDNLLNAAHFWALERGTTNAALGNADTATIETTAQIKKLRESADSALEKAMSLLASSALLTGGTYEGDIQKTSNYIKSLREEVDSSLALPKKARDKNVVSGWMPSITSLILETQKLRISLGTQSLSLDPSLGKDMLIRHSVWLMAEYAGRERGTLAGLISSDEAISPKQLQQLLEFRGKVEEGWNMLTSIHFTSAEHTAFDTPLKTAREDFFGSFETIRSKAYEDAKMGIGYSISVKDWIARSTQAIATLQKMQEVSSQFTDKVLEVKAADAGRSMVFYSFGLLVSLLVVLSAIFVTLSRVLTPIQMLSAAMRKLANSDWTVIVPGLSRRDEIGEMASAVATFKTNGMETERLRADQAVTQKRQLDRASAVESLVSDFEKEIAVIVDNVSDAAIELQATAKTMTTTAKETSAQSGTVATASEQATSNVQTVASATEQLSASIHEIQTRVIDSSKMIGQAAEQVSITNDKVKNLTDTAQKIGAVVNLINDIAAQTNLLALNATIEAARAGDAGKGFAVVASEVKALAAQTARATDEIAQQARSIQDASGRSAEAIHSITQTMDEVQTTSAMIAAAIEQQGSATQDISRNVSEAAKGTKEVSQNIVKVNEGAQQTGAAAAQVLSAAGELARNGDRLKSQVDDFLSKVKAA